MQTMFQRRSQLGLKVLGLLLLSLILMWLDWRVPMFHRARTVMAVVVYPVQWVVDAPIRLVRNTVGIFEGQQALLTDNAKLRAHELLLEAKLQRLLTLEKENAQLRELLQSATHLAGTVEVGQLLAVNSDPALLQVIVDKGIHDKVYVGQPVLDAYGVMGQVIDVSPWTSRVLLVTDSHSQVPVQDYRNGLRAMAVGVGSHMQLRNVPSTADIKQGDLLVSSGLGLRYPVGYPVGIVSSVTHVAGYAFLTINITPSAHLNRSRQVLLARPADAGLASVVTKQLQQPLPHPHKGVTS